MPKSSLAKDSSESATPSGSRDVTRTTIVIPTTLDQNLQALSLTNGRTKNQMITAALQHFVQEKGLRPHQRPKIIVRY